MTTPDPPVDYKKPLQMVYCGTWYDVVVIKEYADKLFLEIIKDGDHRIPGCFTKNDLIFRNCPKRYRTRTGWVLLHREPDDGFYVTNEVIFDKLPENYRKDAVWGQITWEEEIT